MRILSLLSIVLMILLLAGQSSAQENNTSKIFGLMKQKNWQSSYNLAVKTGDPVLKKIVLSQQYLDSKHQDNSFEEIIEFLQQNPYWPQGHLLRLRAESCIDEDTDKQLIVKWFKDNIPATGKGYKYYALAGSTLIKDPEKLAAIIKNGWHHGNFSISDQKSYHNRFKSYLTAEDHVKKIDNHLWNEEISAAQNSLYLVNTGYKKSFKAQIALIKKQKNARILFKRVSKKYYTPGLIHKYLDFRKKELPSSAEIVGLIRTIETDKDYADKFWNIQSYLAREFIEKKRYRDAYKVASSYFTTNACNKSDAEFLSGWLALRFLNKSKLALKHFRNFNRIVKTPISKSRGVYWLGRVYEANRDQEKADRLYNLAASKYPYTFYGQMAAIELGRKRILIPEDIDLAKHKSSALVYAKKNDVARATQIISQYGSNALSQTYIKSVVNKASNNVDILSVASSLNDSKNVHHRAWMAKHALQKHVFIKKHAYPTPYSVNHLPIETPLTYSIIRQESVFDQHAISSAQARGLMQLIKETACDVAEKIVTHCRISKLTTDPVYNMKLGSNHLKQMIEDYDGSYILAIAAYNCGSHNVDKWLKIYGDPRKMKNSRDVLDWLELIPYYETRNYVQRVLENLQIYRVIINKDNKFRLKQDLLNKKRV